MCGALEASLEKPLFLRRSTGLLLTTAGEDLALATREGLDRIADAASGVKRRRRRVSVGVYGFLASRRLLPLWPELRAAHPDGLPFYQKTSIHWGELRVSRRKCPAGWNHKTKAIQAALAAIHARNIPRLTSVINLLHDRN
jgi:DNA-binding transcriptional LysR family regulator